jgi:hypothetical protein
VIEGEITVTRGDRMPRATVRPDLLLALTLCAAAAGCGPGVTQTATSAADQAIAPRADCSALVEMQIPASVIGLPSGGAAITSAVVVGATPQTIQEERVVLAIPEYCRVLGSIAPVDPAAPPINFQVNLPTAWNGKILQFGGSGFNGIIPVALTTAPERGPESLPPDAPYALSRGFVVYGSDSGHQGRGGPGAPPGAGTAWLTNREALENFAYAQMKKTHDVIVEVVRRAYGRQHRLSYYMGTSQGGREALMVAQRFPADYDGILSQVPVIPMSHMMVTGPLLMARSQLGEAWIPPAKVPAIAAEIRRRCDALDGIADGMVSSYLACNARFDSAAARGAFAAIRCVGGADTGDDCLSDAQVGAAEALYGADVFPFPFAHGWTSFAGWSTGGEMPGNFRGLASRPDPQAFTTGPLSPYLPPRSSPVLSRRRST